MKIQLVVALLVCAAVAYAQDSSEYTTKWDGIDLDQVLASNRLILNYHNCLMERGSCTPDVSDLKRNLPDALKTECSKCSSKQKEGAEKVIKFLIKNKPEWWKELQAKYDPEGIYAAKQKELEEKAATASA